MGKTTEQCKLCRGSGFSQYAELFHGQWYGNVPFWPEMTGSAPFEMHHIAVVLFAEHNLKGAPEYYGEGTAALKRECKRLVDIFNACWSHHLEQRDVDALIKADRLWEFTRVPKTLAQEMVVREKVAAGGNSWLPSSNGYNPTALEVNIWSLAGISHDANNCHVVVKARCTRLKLPFECKDCKGHGEL